MTLKKRHFTLIELLAVMALIGMLVSLAIPSFTRLAKGKATPAAADQIKRQLEEAQALAIGNRSYVGLVIPNGTATYYGTAFTANDSPDFSSNTKNQYYLASTRPAFLFKDGSDYYFEKWASDSGWSKPVENARVVKIATARGNLFTGDGEISSPASSTTDELASSLSGFCSVIPRSSNTALGPCAVVFSPEGGLAATNDLYLVIAGCTANGTTLNYTAGNMDYLVLHIDRMSGKVSYYERP